jgi:enoyl-CoA hydratase
MPNSQPSEHDYRRYDALQLKLVEGVMTVTLSNPGKKNAATPQMLGELTTVWDDLAADPAVKVIILTGADGNFCSGVDLNSLDSRSPDEGAPRLGGPSSGGGRAHAMCVFDCAKPTLAKVRGVAYGVGVNMALACDMVFAAEGARLCDSHVKAGMVAGDGGVLLWPLAVGIHRAKEYLMTGEPVPANVAESIGLINRCLPDDDLDEYVQTIAEKLRDLPPLAVNYTKRALNVAVKQMTASALEVSHAYQIYSMRSQDFTEAVSAFVEKRKGVFYGI